MASLLCSLKDFSLGDPYSKSVGSTASNPYTKKNGVNPVAQLGIILRLHKAKGSSAAHFLPCLFNLSIILGFKPCKTMPFARSTWLFVFG
jgi:hypothetical protein